MFQLLTEHPLLTFFLVVALGATLGQVRFGPLRFGAAGALFVGLALSAAHPALGENMALLQSMGLALFVYTVGISAGSTFMSQLRQQTPLMVAAALASILGAVVAVLVALSLNVPFDLTAGLYTGALTAAPALDTALQLTDTAAPSAGYAVGYPFGVLVGLIAVSMVAVAKWKGEKDTPSMAGTRLEARTAHVKQQVNVRDVNAWKQGRVRMSYLRRADRTRVVVPGEDLLPDDKIVIVGPPQAVEAAIREVGEEAAQHLADDRRHVDFERITVSNPDVAGRSIAHLNLPVKFGAVITRVRRGDLEILATDELQLQPGDQVSVAVPSAELRAVSAYLGDSEKRVSEVDALALGLGLVLGMFLGLVTFPMPGGGTFSLGAAAGPLIVGMVLGGLRRTGVLVWSMPEAANLTIRQLGLLFFLGALGLGAGSEFWGILTSPLGWRAVLLAVVTVAASLILIVFAGWFLKLSAPRTAGAVAGFLGQPAVYQEASAKVSDERVEAAYAGLFAFSIITKILLVPAMAIPF
ncbi:aspartate:alanine exchanger family transporter [Gleimia hominis]|uniref:aspartate:alanine exchanger family transporter n=1 Tax=Gleimia hominis TaxID=595468 RepID=UPI000C80AEFA|nr:TrkA C-terminal domain-containing protein [Gleimia hominis]WIK64450.1 TrkA C-terminal domain-containing protein [Gleimia hominis]